MGETRHQGVDMLLGQIQQRLLQRADAGNRFVDRGAKVEADVGGNLVVARSPGMKALAGVADQVGQALLDVEVHVLQVHRPLKPAASDFFEDHRHAALDVGDIGCRQHAHAVQHARMGERAADVELGESFVEIDRRGIALDQLCDRFAEPAGPGLSGVFSGGMLRLHRGSG
jgi:hypothetical protein